MDVCREVKYRLIDSVNYGANVDLAFHGCPLWFLCYRFFDLRVGYQGLAPNVQFKRKEIDCHASEGLRLVRASSPFVLSSPCDPPRLLFRQPPAKCVWRSPPRTPKSNKRCIKRNPRTIHSMTVTLPNANDAAQMPIRNRCLCSQDRARGSTAASHRPVPNKAGPRSEVRLGCASPSSALKSLGRYPMV